MPRKIDMKLRAPRRITALVYGATRTGKTRFAATWPRPKFLSDATEGGWETIRHMDPSLFYEPDFTPRVEAVDEYGDMYKGIQETAEQCKKKPGEIQTLVIDSLTFYADLYFVSLERAQIQKDGKRDTRAIYGDLRNHLRWLMIETHKLPVNVVWLCLANDPNDDNPLGRPMIPGKSADQAPARCDYLLYTRAYRQSVDADTEWEIRTRPYGRYVAGGRDGGILPDPLPEPTYRALADVIGMTPKATASQTKPRRIVTATGK